LFFLGWGDLFWKRESSNLWISLLPGSFSASPHLKPQWFSPFPLHGGAFFFAEGFLQSHIPFLSPRTLPFFREPKVKSLCANPHSPGVFSPKGREDKGRAPFSRRRPLFFFPAKDLPRELSLLSFGCTFFRARFPFKKRVSFYSFRIFFFLRRLTDCPILPFSSLGGILRRTCRSAKSPRIKDTFPR